MGFLVKLKDKVKAFSEEDLERPIRMGWGDRSTFEAIESQFGLTPNDFIRLIPTQLDSTASRVGANGPINKGT